MKYQSLTSHDEAPLGLANSFVMLSQLFFVTGHDGLLGLCYSPTHLLAVWILVLFSERESTFTFTY